MAFDIDQYLASQLNKSPKAKVSTSKVDEMLSKVQAASQAKKAELMVNSEIKKPLPTQTDVLDIIGDIATKVSQGVVQFGAGVAGLSTLATDGLVGKGLREIGYDPKQSTEFLGGGLSDAQQASDAKVADAKGFIDTVVTSVENPRSIVGSVAESLPSMLGGMGVSGMAARKLATKAALNTVEGRLASEAAIAAGRAEQAGAAALNTEAGSAAGKAAIEKAGFKLSAIGAGAEGAQTAGNIADQAQGAGREYTDYALPAILGGLGTAAIGMVSNKVFGDAGTDIATGARTLTGGKAAKIVKGAVSEGIAEEMPQSAQEQIATNVAMGEKDVLKGVAEAAGQGLVAGAAMGAGMSVLHGDHSKAKPSTEPEKSPEMKEKIAAAVQSNDISTFIDPKNKQDYDLTVALKVLVDHANLETTTPETKNANVKQAGELLAKLEEQHAEVKESVFERSPEGMKPYQEDLAKVEAELAKVNPADTKEVARLTEYKTDLTEHLADLADPKEAEKAKISLSQIERQLETGRGLVSSLVSATETVATPEEVTSLVNQISNKTDTPATAEANERLITLAMTQPDVLTDVQASALAEDKSNTLTDAQRAHLRVFSEARQVENLLSTQSKVSQEVMFGSDKNMGIAQYRSQVATAISAGSVASAMRSLDGLSAFTTDHEDKYATARKSLTKYGLGAQIVSEAGEWKAYPKGTFSPEVLRKNGGLALNSARLVQDIGKESVALRAAYKELKSATDLKFAVQSKSSKQTAVPPGNINTPTDEEDTARPALRTEPPTAQAPTAKATKHGVLTGMDQEDRVKANLTKSKAQREAKAKQAQEEAAKTAAVEQPAAVSEANPAPVAETTPAEAEAAKEKSHTLTVFDTEHKADAPYQKQNLIGVHFTQRAGEETSPRPLAKVADFLSALKNKSTKISDFVQQKGEFTDEQRAVVSDFVTKANAWKENIKANLRKGNAGYGFEDPIQFLMNEQGDLDENVKTAIAYAAYSWVAENASRPAINTKEEINIILGREETALVGLKERNALEHVGTRQNVVTNSLGQRIVAALGLKASPNAPRNLQADLEASVGAHAMKLLMDQGILVRSTITGAEMAELTGSKNTDSKAAFYFLKLAQTEGKLNTTAEDIYQKVKGTKSILDKLFGVEPALKEPSTEPVKSKQKTTRNTDQGIPAELAAQVAKDDAEPSFVRADMYNLVGQIQPEIMEQITGKEEGGTAVHKSRRLSIEAKNNGLARELDRFMSYVGQAGSDVAMYFEHSVWMQQRVGIATNMVNPQTSKIHRHMLYRSAWETKINVKDSSAMDNFKLRVAEGLGVKTDKKNKEKALNDFADLMLKPEIKGAVNVLVKSLEGPDNGSLSDNEQQVLLAGVKKGGENMHSLDALMALAQYKLAVKEGKTSFTTQMMAEVDGVTNGPMLSHLLLGAANDVREMFALLNRGGFFEQGNDHTEYNNWRDAPGNFDLYENTALHMTQAINTAGFDLSTMEAIYAFTGDLADSKGVVTKAGRNIIKTPLTAMVFGSSVNNAVDSMADNFIESIYDAIESDSMTHEEIRAHLSTMGIDLSAKLDLMEHEFTPTQVKVLKSLFKETLGEAVKSTMEEDFAVFIAQRAEFNKTAQLNFEVYNAVYTGIRETMIANLIKEGKIAVNPTTGQPIHDLTNAQEKELRQSIEALAPIMHSPLSKTSGDLKSGLMVAKSSRKLSTSPAYQNVVKFGQPFSDNGSKTASVHGYEVVPTGPGVAMVPVSMHSSDSAISVRANTNGQALNVHDAQGHGVGGILETARKMNEATWTTMLNYSPASEVKDALLRTVQGLNAMLQAGNVPDVVLTNLASALVDFAEKHELPAEGALFFQAAQAQDMAYRADAMKLDTMVEMQAVNQYAMEGGAYAVTTENRSSAASLRSALEVGLSADASSALTSVSDKLDAAIKAELAKRTGKPQAKAKVDPEMDKPAKTSDVAQLGKSSIKSDPDLVKAFEQKPQMSFSEAIALLKGKVTDDFRLKLLGQLERVTGDSVKINYVTAATPAASLLALGAANSRGWYSSTASGSRAEINILSPEFKNSGLTVELLMHEMTHAALAQAIDAAQTKGSGPAFELVQELEELRTKAAEYIEATGKGKEFSAAVADVQELVAWGMNNSKFQDIVLRNVSMVTTTGGNKLMEGMKRFAQLLTKLLFGRTHDGMADGITVLISNVSGLFNAAAKTKTTGTLTLNQVNNVRDLSTIDIYAALEQSNNGAVVSAEHSTHLQGLLNTIVKSIYGPFGSFKETLMKQTAQDPMDVYTEALATGVAPFASESLAAGFAFTDQEAFVLEQVEATMRTALQSKDGTISVAYKELTKLYSEVRNKLTVESFHKGDWATATPDEQAQAQALYDFVFAIKQDASGRSDYMSRFAALGLTHAGFREQLGFYTTDKPANPNMGFNERLNKIFNLVMSWIAGKMTDTFKGQRADLKLDSLVRQIVAIEAKKLVKLENQSSVLNSISATAGDMTEGVKAAVEKFGKKPFFQKSGNEFVKLAGNAVSAIAGDRVDLIMEGYQKLRDRTMTGQLGVAAALVNEVRGATEATQIYQFLLRATKHLEGQRKDVMTNISKAVSNSFADEGEYLTADHKKAMTTVVLRGDMQSLLGQFTLSDLGNMVRSKSALQTEIDAHEAQLTGKMSRFYINSAKALGYFMATSKITVAHQLFNAGNIARVMGTGMSKQVSEAQAQIDEQIIDRLASLYSIKYASEEDLNPLIEVFTQEDARTDGGHGLEMIMKTHRALQVESKAKLFAGSETMMMKGYVPEIYDPYMSVVMANDEEGLDLIKRGYVPMPGYLGQDSADPSTDRKRIYSLRDGGMKQWNSGIFSTTDTRAKGNRIVSGAHPVSLAGQQNAATMASIRTAKRASIQSMFTGKGFDPSKVTETHMAPVLNPNGDITNYRYMMSNHVKDKLLNRDNRTDRLLGSIAGNTFDKVTAKVQNQAAVKALYDQYKADYTENPRSYLLVGPTSSDPQLREIWDMLPRDTQLYAKSLFGQEGMRVRNDVLDINFGYRKLSIGTVFDKEETQRTFVEKMFVEIMTSGFGEKAQLRTRQFEDIWQAIVKETKANLVVKSWSTMSGNLRSNWSQLFLMGVSPLQILKSHRVAFKSAWEYKQDSAKLFDLKHQQKIGYLSPGQTAANLEYQVKRLEDSLARNPIRPLIDAGLMPTIVEDVSVDEDIYSYKSRFTEKVDGFVDNINPHILKATQLLTMHHSTAPYKVMSYATQISDFLARYTLYQHDISKANPLTHEQAVQRASESFINYDVPTHRKIQYANDSGLIMFSKYYIRIQKVLARIYKDSPGRVLALMAAEHMIGNQPTVLDSGFTHHFGNPFNAGALSYIGSLDSVTTVGLITSPFTTAVYNGQ